MGLDTSHDAWHGAYSAFARWRDQLAGLVGIPLGLMEGHYRGGPTEEAMGWASARPGGPLCNSHCGPHLHHWIEGATRWLPISWEVLRPDILHVLLHHSDCDGSISTADCGPLADRLAGLLPGLDRLPDDDGHIGNWGDKTRKFIDGLRRASAAGEDVEFR